MKLDPLDIVFAKAVKLNHGAIPREDDNGRVYLHGDCEYCGEWKPLQISHFHSRNCRTTRYDEENVACLCGGCHKLFEEHPNLHSEWFEKRIGSDRFEKLSIKANKTIKDHPIDKEGLLSYYKERIKELENGRLEI